MLGISRKISHWVSSQVCTGRGREECCTHGERDRRYVIASVWDLGAWLQYSGQRRWSLMPSPSADVEFLLGQ